MKRMIWGVIAAAALAFAPAASASTKRECPEPAPVRGADGDNTRDAAGRGQLFERIAAPPVTASSREGGGVALLDLNRDGHTDIVYQYDDDPTPTLYLGDGCFRFAEQPLEFRGETLKVGFGGASTPTFADFDGDGLLDLYVTRRGLTSRSSLYLARGAYDVFEDVTPAMGVGNGGAANTQASIADVNGDGWLDIAAAADQTSQKSGRPMQRLFIYRPPKPGGRFEDGRFEDIGMSGTGLVPGFGGSQQEKCDAKVDRGGPSIALRDLDGDRDLDLVQPYHNDMVYPNTWDDPCATGEWRSGISAWRNTLAETGRFGFEELPPGDGGAFDDDDLSLGELGQMRYVQERQQYEPVRRGVSLPYLNTADIDNDGDLDPIVVGPTDPEWHVNSDMMAGKLWRNEGGFRFRAATSEAGLDALNWTYGTWTAFWKAPVLPMSEIALLACSVSNQRPKCATMTTSDHQFYAADTVFGDYNNDGSLDFLLADRHEAATGWSTMRNVLFLGRGDGTFKPLTTEISGIDTSSVAAETGDLNDDGLLDLYFIAQPSHSYPVFRDIYLPADRQRPKVYWNTGQLGGARNHWLKVQLRGLPERRLIGARIIVRDVRTGRLLGSRDYFSNDSYKSSHALEVHFGLGRRTAVRVEVRLANGGTRMFRRVRADRTASLRIRPAARARDER